MVPCSVDMKSPNIASCLACLLAFIKGSKCKLCLASSAVPLLLNVVLRFPIDWQEGGRAMGADRRPAFSILCSQWLRPALSVNARKREAGRIWSPTDRWSFPETNLDMFFILEKKTGLFVKQWSGRVTFAYLQNGTIKIEGVKEDIVMSN